MVNNNTKEIICKWYDKLGFMPQHNAAFEQALAEIEISDTITAENYDCGSKDGKRNLLSFLFMCEALEKKYKEKGIDEKILVDTMRDISIWTDVWSKIKGETYLGELGWLRCHLLMKLFRLGSLEFMAGKSTLDCPELELKKGDNIVEVHIPHNASLSKESCERSLNMAREFFAKYYPDYNFNYFTCHSWLLDTELEKFLKPESNILGFQRMFNIIEGAEDESYSALKYIFDWDTNEKNLINKHPVSSLAENIKKHVLAGGKLYARLGVIKK